jgi:hypothetical protein
MYIGFKVEATSTKVGCLINIQPLHASCMGFGTWTPTKVVVEKQFLYTFSTTLEKNLKLQTNQKEDNKLHDINKDWEVHLIS